MGERISTWLNPSDVPLYHPFLQEYPFTVFPFFLFLFLSRVERAKPQKETIATHVASYMGELSLFS